MFCSLKELRFCFRKHWHWDDHFCCSKYNSLTLMLLGLDCLLKCKPLSQ